MSYAETMASQADVLAQPLKRRNSLGVTPRNARELLTCWVSKSVLRKKLLHVFISNNRINGPIKIPETR